MLINKVIKTLHTKINIEIDTSRNVHTILMTLVKLDM